MILNKEQLPWCLDHLKETLKDAEANQDKLEKLIASYEKKNKEAEDIKEEVARLLQKAKELKAKLDKELAGRGERQIAINRTERMQSDRDEQQDAREVGLNTREAKQEERQRKQDIKDKTLKRGLAELANQRIETKVLEERVRKLIRDNKLKKELEQLESSLRP